MKKYVTRIAALFLAFGLSLGMTIPAYAADSSGGDVSPQASDYISSYAAWAGAGSGGKVYIYYDIDATGYVARVGAKLIVVQVLDAGVWTNVKTITGTTSNGMLLSNAAAHTGNIVYQGTAGKSYRAVVTVYAGPTSGGDSRIVTTNSVTAKS